MTLTFSKTLLATAIMLGLTACGSGGGSGGSQSPTTTSNNSQISVPVPNGNNTSANQSDTTANNPVSHQDNNATTDNKPTPKPGENNKPDEIINIPTVDNSTENNQNGSIWEALPLIPKIETSTVTGQNGNLKGKATYFSKNAGAYFQTNPNEISPTYSRVDKESFIILNADFDNKSINGTSAYNFKNNETGEKIAQVQVTFKDATLYKDPSRAKLTFAGDSIGKMQTKDNKYLLSGEYKGNIDYKGEKLYMDYDLKPIEDKSVSVHGVSYITKQ